MFGDLYNCMIIILLADTQCTLCLLRTINRFHAHSLCGSVNSYNTSCGFWTVEIALLNYYIQPISHQCFMIDMKVVRQNVKINYLDLTLQLLIITSEVPLWWWLTEKEIMGIMTFHILLLMFRCFLI